MTSDIVSEIRYTALSVAVEIGTSLKQVGDSVLYMANAALSEMKRGDNASTIRINALSRVLYWSSAARSAVSTVCHHIEIAANRRQDAKSTGEGI